LHFALPQWRGRDRFASSLVTLRAPQNVFFFLSHGNFTINLASAKKKQKKYQGNARKLKKKCNKKSQLEKKNKKMPRKCEEIEEKMQ
jgi:hypothetical protein